jgi:hypothetical protein
MTDEDQRASEYRRQCERRHEFQQTLVQKLKGDDYARRQLCLKTKPAMKGTKGDTSYDD